MTKGNKEYREFGVREAIYLTPQMLFPGKAWPGYIPLLAVIHCLIPLQAFNRLKSSCALTEAVSSYQVTLGTL